MNDPTINPNVWRCPCGDLQRRPECSCGNGHYRIDGEAIAYDPEGLLEAYSGPRLCPYDGYRPCGTPDQCHGNLVHGHCKRDARFEPKAETYEPPPREWRLASHAPMFPEGAPLAYIDGDRCRGYDTAAKVPEHLRVPTGGNGLAYCAVNRGCCPMPGECGDGCTWRKACDTWDPDAVRLCMEYCEDIITEGSDPVGGSYSYKALAEHVTKQLKDEEPVEDHDPVAIRKARGDNLEEMVGMSDREAAYDAAIQAAFEDSVVKNHYRPRYQQQPVFSTAPPPPPNQVDPSYMQQYTHLPELDARRATFVESNQQIADNEREFDGITPYWKGQPIADPDRNPKDIAGSTKPQYHLVPVTPGVARVMESGAVKYGPYNWREKRITYTAYISACLRHIKAFMEQEDNDPESLQLHTEHAAACMLILSDAIVHGTALDDRPHNPQRSGR